MNQQKINRKSCKWVCELRCDTCDFSSHDLTFSGESPLDNFDCLSEDDVTKLLVPVITGFINSSLTKREVPSVFKEAVITPLLKKPGLELTYKNYRPVSNLSMDDKRAVLLALLDLSAAFDTVDHKIMINRLEHVLGITGTALKWFKSYLSGRSQRVSIAGAMSHSCPLDCCVSQGSV